VFLTILQIISLEVMLIRVQGWINVDAYVSMLYQKSIRTFFQLDKYYSYFEKVLLR